MTSLTNTFRREAYPTIDPTAPQNSQSGRTILISGGTTGIGLAMAKAFLQAKPSTVIITGRREETLKSALEEAENTASGSKVIAHVCDIGNEQSITELWTSLKVDGVVVDTMVLNAAKVGLTSGTQPLATVWPMFEVNFLGNARMTDHFMSQGPHSGKVLINISTARIHANPQSANEGYGPSKLAFVKALEALSDKTPRSELQITTLEPGRSLSEAALRAGLGSEKWVYEDNSLPSCLAVWLSTTQASFLHGRFIWANWDVDELIGMKGDLEKDPGLLRVGLNGIDNVVPAELMTFLRGVGPPKGEWRK